MNKAPHLHLFVWVFGVLLSLPAFADSQLYTNGPINGDYHAWSLGSGNTVSDSFGLGSASVLGSISFGDWVSKGDTPLSITWSISSSPLGGGTVFASGTSSLTNTLFCSAGPLCGDGNYNVYTSAFATKVALSPGSYYLNLSNIAATARNNLAGWDENDGVGCSGVGCPSGAYDSTTGAVGSESFSLYALNPIPEPSTVLDILGSGAFASVGLIFSGRLRQKLFRR
jgi:hypothetical protein